MLAGAPQGAIQEIAYRCGFASAAHFSRAFKERYGMTPRAYAANRKTAAANGTGEVDCDVVCASGDDASKAAQAVPSTGAAPSSA
jgi:AraC-like DNA-binding protein